MIHVRWTADRTQPLCDTGWQKGDKLVDAALASDCNACRGQLKLEPVIVDKKTGMALNVKPVPTWKADPMPNARKIVKDAIKYRDGR